MWGGGCTIRLGHVLRLALFNRLPNCVATPRWQRRLCNFLRFYMLEVDFTYQTLVNWVQIFVWYYSLALKNICHWDFPKACFQIFVGGNI